MGHADQNNASNMKTNLQSIWRGWQVQNIRKLKKLHIKIKIGGGGPSHSEFS